MPSQTLGAGIFRNEVQPPGRTVCQAYWLMAVPPSAPIVAQNPDLRPGNGLGIAMMLLGFFLFSAADTIAKLMTESLHPVQIVWTRQLGLLVPVLGLLLIRGRGILRTKAPVLQVSRGVVAVGSAVCFVMAIRHVPLADAVAVSFVAPFIVTILGALMLRETVGIRRWAAVSIGFVGTMIVIRPGLGVMHPAVFLVIFAASMFAVRQILSRMLAGADGLATTVAYTSITSSLILTLPLPFFWQWPDSPRIWMMLVAMAAIAGCAEFCIIKALDIAQAVVLAPLMYSLILWGTFYGFVVFGDLPDGFTWLGTAIIIATGVYTINRERLALKAARRNATTSA